MVRVIFELQLYHIRSVRKRIKILSHARSSP